MAGVPPMNDVKQPEFAHTWTVKQLAGRPLILPRLHVVYPAVVDEVEIGALEIMVTPQGGEPFLATCALGFAAKTIPTGVWSCPHPDWLCAIAGGYAYLMNTRDPSQWEQVEYRPVVEVLSLVDSGLLVFASFHTLLAFGVDGKAWKTSRLTSEGLRLEGVRDGRLHGWGWDMQSDREFAFSVDLETGEHTSDVAM
jgi:hypothetical protein